MSSAGLLLHTAAAANGVDSAGRDTAGHSPPLAPLYSSSYIDVDRASAYTSSFTAPRVTHRSPSTSLRSASPQPPHATTGDCDEDDEYRDKHKPPLVAQLRRRWLRFIAGLTVSDCLLLALLALLPCVLLRQVYVHDRQHDQHASSDSALTASAAIATPAWETTHDLSVQYHLVVVNLLPYTDSAADSSGTTITMRGQYSDQTSFTYPLCTFARVCLTSSHVLLSFSNLTVHTFYSLTLPYCRDRLYRKFGACGCFHGGYRPVVLPYAFEASDEDSSNARRVAMQMIERRFGTAEQWTRDGQAADEQVTAAREIPTMDELAATTHSSPRLYADPFMAPDASSVASAPALSFRYFPSHFYTIHKWVNLHHIAHWAQKLLVMQATLGHYHHACRHTYNRMEHSGASRREGSGSGRAEVEEFAELWKQRADNRRFSPLPYRMECLPELSGVLCHDTYAPLYEHEENIMDISVHALSDWVDSLGDDVSAHSPPPALRLPTQWMSLHPWLPPVRSLPAAFSPSFSHSSSVIFTNELFTAYSADYLSDIEKWNRQLPPPENVNTLSCFARVSFSPLFGTFVDNAYDAQQWRKRAMRHYGLREHRSHFFRDVEVRPASNITAQQLMAGAAAAGDSEDRRLLALRMDGSAALRSHAAATSIASPSAVHIASDPFPFITHSATAAIGLSSCPPSSAVLIYRPDRSMLNQGELLAYLKQKYNLLVHPTAVDGSTSSFDQARIFASAGLILSPHSSQLVNVMFAHSSAAVVEVTGEFYNLDFARYATSMGVYFRYAIGGHFPAAHQPPDPLMADCVRELHQCGGDNFCIAARAERHCRQGSYFPNKNLPYYANLTAVDVAVRQALSHLLKHCYGRWQEVRLAPLV